MTRGSRRWSFAVALAAIVSGSAAISSAAPPAFRPRVPPELRALFRALPKTELHAHLGGSTPIRLVRRFFREQGLDEQAIREQTTVKPRFRNLADFIQTYRRVAVLTTPDQMRRSAAAFVRQAASENVRDVELRESVDNEEAEGSPEENIRAIEQGLREGAAWVKAHRGYDIGVGFIVAARRTDPPAKTLAAAKRTVAMARRPGSLIRGFDLAGDEAHHPASEHAAALRYFSRYGKPLGLGLTMHAGETPRSGDLTGAESVWDALRRGADRIGHGLAIVDDPELLAEVVARGIPVELAPWSNVQTGAVAGYADHPLPKLLAAGVEVNLSTDDRLLFRRSLSGQLGDLYRYGLVRDWEALKRITLSGVRASFAPDRAQREQEVVRELERIEAHPVYRRAIARYLSGRD